MDERIKAGNKVVLKTTDGDLEGIVMERPSLADQEHVVLKLDNGYNIGVSKEKIKDVKVLSMKHEVEEYKPRKQELDKKKPTVSILATGGTIASRVDYLTGGVHSAFTAEELVSAVPELSEVANINARQVFNKFSENMQPSDWVKIAEEVAKEIKSGVSGVVVTHGTDTMHYTASALSFMLTTPVPVVLTGAQRSSDRGSSDAAMNLIDAVVAAAYGDFGEVCLVMHGETGDSFSRIHPGTKTRKMHTSRRDAFETINSEALGKVVNRKIEYSRRTRKLRGGETRLEPKIEEKVFLLKIHPGLKPDFIDSLAKQGYRGVLLEGTGLGHTSDDLIPAVKKAIGSGTVFAMASQTIYGRVNMNVYSTGRNLLDAGVISCEDMLPETAFVKLMWALGQAKDRKKVTELMQKSIAGEISTRTLIE